MFVFAILLLFPNWLLSQAAPLPSAAGPRPTIEPKKHTPYVETIPGTKVKFEMVAIPGGTFLMGSPKSEKGRQPDEGPRHWVQVRAFWMGKYEVTWDELDASLPLYPTRKEDVWPNCIITTHPSMRYSQDVTFGLGAGQQPALSISHFFAMKYCEWLSLKTGKTYRLPTEAEWEYACRAGTTTAFSFGDDSARLKDYAWYEQNGEDGPLPGGKKLPNAWGLYDMHGNLAEWCLDHYQKDYYADLAGKSLLSRGPVLLPTERRFPYVVRGGSWADPAHWCRSAARRASQPAWNKRDPRRPKDAWWLSDADFVGFRLVRPVEEQDNLKGLKPKFTP